MRRPPTSCPAPNPPAPPTAPAAPRPNAAVGRVATAGYARGMGKAIKFTLLGAAIGAGAVAARSRGGESSGDMPAKAAKGAGCGAAAGGLVGFVLDRRSKRKLKRRMELAAMVNAGALVEAARAAKPAIGKQS